MSKVNDLKQENEIKIRECLYDGQIWTKNDLAYKTSLSLATTTNILQEMLKSHEIEYVSDSKSTGGRKSKEYQLYKDYKHLLKIVLKKNKKSYEFIFEIIDLYDQIVYQKNYSSLKGTVEEFLKIIKEVLKKDQEIAVICLSLPGVCDQGMIDLCDFEDFQNKNILEILKKEIKQKIIIENDVNCASIGFYHQYSHYQNSALIYQPAVDYVGYGIDYTNPAFNQLGEDILKQELNCSLKKLELTNQLGFDLKKEQLDALSSNGVYTGEMFGEALLKDERYVDHELLKPYRSGGSRSDNPYVNFYWDYYAQGKPCYTEVIFPSLEKTIQLINDHGGVAVLAHPGNNLKGKFDIFNEMVEKGLQGVECFSSYHSLETNDYFYQKAKELDLLYTCGSDFHGKTKPAIHLGENGCVSPDEIKELLIKYQLIRG